MNRQDLLLEIKTDHKELYDYLNNDPEISSIFNHIEDAHPGEIYLLNRKIGAGIGFLEMDFFLTCELRFQW